MTLDASERRTLLTLARSAIRDALLGDGSLDAALRRAVITAALRESRGLFVTLKACDPAADPPVERLRGCVGTLTPNQTLVPELVTLAPRAALQDPRFPPLPAEEFDSIRLSLSILSPPEPLLDPARLILGEHGVHLVKNYQRSVFLPQVAVEQGWNREQLLGRLARKAGLPPDDWKTAELSVFTAEAFGEATRPE